MNSSPIILIEDKGYLWLKAAYWEWIRFEIHRGIWWATAQDWDLLGQALVKEAKL